MEFTKVWKREFNAALKLLGAEDVVHRVGHFTVSGNFTVRGQPWYYSMSDVRWSQERIFVRKCKDYNDFTGEINHYVPATRSGEFLVELGRIIKNG
jgi:hypothetical protein